ncbi:MAG TPA: hypothetical protein ENJ13_06115 [Chromatiales bacterium]|nr:hypothetical protein [Chromatiales bacterium]
MDLNNIALLAGIIIGALMIMSVIYTFSRHRCFGIGGFVITAFGVTLIGLTVWSKVSVSVSSEGNFEAKFEALEKTVNSLQVIDVDTWDEKSPNREYTPAQSGFVSVHVRANNNNRFVIANGLLNGKFIASTAAQDSTVPGVPSITSGSFLMPVPTGSTWKVAIKKEHESLAQVKWFTRKSTLISEAVE